MLGEVEGVSQPRNKQVWGGGLKIGVRNPQGGTSNLLSRALHDATLDPLPSHHVFSVTWSSCDPVNRDKCQCYFFPPTRKEKHRMAFQMLFSLQAMKIKLHLWKIQRINLRAFFWWGGNCKRKSVLFIPIPFSLFRRTAH